MNEANSDKYFLQWILWLVGMTFQKDFHIMQTNTVAVYSQARMILRSITVIFTWLLSSIFSVVGFWENLVAFSGLQESEFLAYILYVLLTV